MAEKTVPIARLPRVGVCSYDTLYLDGLMRLMSQGNSQEDMRCSGI